ncbi:hypothetical protein H6G33_10435 [Calothrix sp. FACHB-1219]|uniref:hypothetical protein n=1 Tax=unclassified Calothrix TaxID=2619626 RepID=UPI0016897233|nr:MULTISPECIES: hypothetical protein [unclassified Calothrix]MBD2201764.1 hypothetical protein [Calothrix sp. FACHB-168]MBD2217450.1 hypothetical protein [Calothrix sp. FACHB-1219]
MSVGELLKKREEALDIIRNIDNVLIKVNQAINPGVYASNPITSNRLSSNDYGRVQELTSGNKLYPISDKYLESTSLNEKGAVELDAIVSILPPEHNELSIESEGYIGVSEGGIPINQGEIERENLLKEIGKYF